MAEIEKIAVYDARIIQDPPKFAVQKGALSVSTSTFNANAANASQLSFQVLVPSLNVFTDRKLELNASSYVYAEAVPSQIVLQSTGRNVPTTIPAGLYIADILDESSYRPQDSPTAPGFPSNGVYLTNPGLQYGGNTACIVPENAWPGLIGTRPLINLFNASGDITPTTFQTINASEQFVFTTATTSVTQQAVFVDSATQPNPFLAFCTQNGLSSIAGTFQFNYNVLTIFSGFVVNQGLASRTGASYAQWRFDLMDAVTNVIYGTALAPVAFSQSADLLTSILTASTAGSAAMQIVGSIPVTQTTLKVRMTLICGGGWTGINATWTAAINQSYAGAIPQPQFTISGPVVNSVEPAVYRNWYQPIGSSTDLSLGMFPIQSLATSMTATINDCSVSVTGDVLREQLLLSQTRDSLMQRTCPSKFDMYAWTSDDARAENGATNSYKGARDSDIPNGSYPLRFVHPQTGDLLNQYDAYTYILDNGTSVTVPVINWVPAFIPINSNLIGQTIPSSTIPGGWVITPTNANVVTPTMYRFQTVEPLCLSPFLWQDSKQMSEVGLYGVTNITINMTLGQPGPVQGYDKSTTVIAPGNRGRLYMDKLNNPYGSYQYMTRQSGINSLFGGVRLQPPRGNAGNQNGPWYATPKLLCTFLTPPPEITLPLVSSVPYVEFPRYNSSSSVTWNAAGSTQVVSSNTVTLSSIPDLLVVWVRPAFRGQTQGDTYIPISNIGVTFDNYANLCSNYSQEDLYACSVAGGLDMDYNQFRGFARSTVTTLTPVASGQLATGFFDTFTGYAPNVQLTGSPIVLRMGQDIPLSSGLAPGTLGNYSVQVNLTLDNTNGFFNYLSAINTSNNVVITIMGVNSGFFESVRGSSALRKTILNTNDVEAASTSSSVTSSQLVRLIGGASGMHTSSRLTTTLGMPQFKPAMGDDQRVRKMARMSGSMIP